MFIEMRKAGGRADEGEALTKHRQLEIWPGNLGERPGIKVWI